MKIALVRPNYKTHIITPHLGLGYLSSYLKQNGIETCIVDGLKENLRFDALIRKILCENPDVLGITCLTAYYNEVVALSRCIKKNYDIPVIIGGIHPTFLPYQTLMDSNADYVICGEGEIALVKLLMSRLHNSNIRGVYSRDAKNSCQGHIEKTEIINNLDDLPFPDWEAMIPQSYPIAPHGAFVKNHPSGIITTSRGCPHQCTFCASPNFYGRKVRFRTPENVVQEIEYLVNDFTVKEIHFSDDILTLNRPRIEKICNLILQRGIKIDWTCPNGIRVDQIDEDLLRLMKASGCYLIAYGIESANSEIRKNVKKTITVDMIKKAITMTKKIGIITQGFFIFGLPGETKETIEESIRFAKELHLDRATFLLLDVLPGSELWVTLKGKFDPDWSKASFQEPEWIPEGLSKKQLMGAQVKAFKEFYSRPKYLFGLLKFVKLSQLRFLFKRLVDYRIYKS